MVGRSLSKKACTAAYTIILTKCVAPKVVFWTNSENDLPCGSVADKSKKTDEEVKLGNGIKENGSGNEIME